MNYVAKSLLTILSFSALSGCQLSPRPAVDNRPLATTRLILDGPQTPSGREDLAFLSDQLKDIAPDLIRISVRPSDLDCGSNCFEDVVTALTSNGTQAIIILAVNDDTINDGLSPSSGEERAQYLKFAGKIVTQLSNAPIAYYQLGDRVNSEGKWRPKVDVTAYSNLYKETATLLSSIDPDSPLIPSSITDGDTNFLNAFLDAVGPTTIPVLQMTPQHWGQSPAAYKLAEKAEAFQAAAEKRVPDAKVWMTGIDYGTHVGGATWHQQAEWYTDAMMLAMNVDGIDAVGFRGLEKDRSPIAPHDGAASGLLTHEGAKKPAFDRLAFLRKHTTGRSYRETITAPEGISAMSFLSADRGDYMTILRSQSATTHIIEANVSANSAVLHHHSGRMVLDPAFEYVTFTVGPEPVVLYSYKLPEFSEQPSIAIRSDEELQYNNPFEVIYTEKPYRSEPEYLIFRKTSAKWQPETGFKLLSTESDSSLAAHQVVYTMNATKDAAASGVLNLNLHLGEKANPFGVIEVPYQLAAPLDLHIAPSLDAPAISWEFTPKSKASMNQVAIQVSANQGALQVPDRFVYTEETANQKQSGDVALVLDNDLLYPTAVTVESHVPDYPTIKMMQELAPQVIIPTTGVIAIDGVLSEWDGTTTFALDRIDQVVADWNPDGEVAPEDDASAMISVTYNDKHLLVAGTVRDDVLSSPGKAGDLYLNDGIEVYLDLDLISDVSSTRYSSDDFQLGLYWEQGKPVVYTWPSRRYLTNAAIAMKATEGGYTLEASIPWSDLGGKPTEGSMIGFNVALSDDDSPAYNLPEGQEKMLTWNGKGSLFRNPSNFVPIQIGKVPHD